MHVPAVDLDHVQIIKTVELLKRGLRLRGEKADTPIGRRSAHENAAITRKNNRVRAVCEDACNGDTHQ
jgi:hypothetical protein